MQITVNRLLHDHNDQPSKLYLGNTLFLAAGQLFLLSVNPFHHKKAKAMANVSGPCLCYIHLLFGQIMLIQYPFQFMSIDTTFLSQNNAKNHDKTPNP